MPPRIDTTIEFRHTQSVGPALVYILPHASEAFLKLGFSRDPLQRMQALHRRYFDFFDIERAILIETTHVREARRIETTLKRLIVDHRAPAPLDIRTQAGGATEWYRGAFDVVQEMTSRYESQGYIVHRDARPWLRTRLIASMSLLYEWSLPRWQALEENVENAASIAQVLLDAMDAYRTFGIDITNSIPPSVAKWYLQQCER